jgi:uncharacterized membrane protein YoaK (UPF0700 family)
MRQVILISLLLLSNSLCENHFTKSFVRIALIKDSCITDNDCEALNHCDNISKECVHKNFLPPTLRELIGGILIVFGSALSNAGGIGGGGLLIPILLLVLNFKTHEAIPISKLMIFTGALTSFIMGLKNRNPYRDAISVDLNIALVLIPMILFGTMVGVTLNRVTPPWIILICLAVVLVVNTWKTTKKLDHKINIGD